MIPFLLAQLVTLVVFNAAGAVVSSQVYTVECGLVPKLVQEVPVIDPVEAYGDDQADPTKDCRALIAAQIQALPYGTGYKMAALKEDGTYGPPSVPFQAGTPPPPPPIKTCVYLGVYYGAPFTFQSDFQWDATKAAANAAAMQADGWTLVQTKKANKKWQWWRATCV